MFVDGGASAVLFGLPGVGKARVGVAVAAWRAGCSIYCGGFGGMVRDLMAVVAAGRVRSKVGTYLRLGVLVVGEVGCRPFGRAEASLVFRVVSERCEEGSIIFASDGAFSEWGRVFGDGVLASALLGRLFHACEVISVNGPGCRLGNRLGVVGREIVVA